MDIYDIKGIYDKGYVNGSIVHKGYADFGVTASDYRFGVTERSKRLIEGRAKPEGIIVVKFSHPINSEKLIVFTESDLEKFAVKNSSFDGISLNEEVEKIKYNDISVGDEISLKVKVIVDASFNIYSRKDDNKFSDHPERKKDREEFKRITREMSDEQINEYAERMKEEKRKKNDVEFLKSRNEYAERMKEEKRKKNDVEFLKSRMEENEEFLKENNGEIWVSGVPLKNADMTHVCSCHNDDKLADLKMFRDMLDKKIQGYLRKE